MTILLAHSSSVALCSDPPTIVNGMRTFSGNSVNDTATYSCNSSFELIGDATTTCTAAADGNSATFLPVPPPTCRREYCIISYGFVACLQVIPNGVFLDWT